MILNLEDEEDDVPVSKSYKYFITPPKKSQSKKNSLTSQECVEDKKPTTKHVRKSIKKIATNWKNNHNGTICKDHKYIHKACMKS